MGRGDSKSEGERSEVPATDVTLRKVHQTDAEALAQVVRESISVLAGTLGDMGTPDFTAADAVKWMRDSALTDQRNWLIVEAATSGDASRIIGTVGLIIDVLNRKADACYWMRGVAQRRGVATHADRQLLHLALHQLNLQRVELVVAVDNVPSARVADKVGAVRESRMRSRFFKNGRQGDAWCYVVCPEEPE